MNASLSVAKTDHYLIDVDPGARRDLAVKWLWLAVLALAGAGVFSILLVLARTPFVGEIIPYANFFRTALVIHVNLSVLVWILAFAGVLWCLASRDGFERVHWWIFRLVCLATVMLVVPGFLPEASPRMSNYIPVLDTPVFLTGLVLFGVGMGALVLVSMSVIPPVGMRVSRAGVLRFGLNCAAISVLVSLLAFAWSWWQVPTEFSADIYYEMLFWGGGHVVQYTYTLVMMVCWLWLTSVARTELVMSERIVLLVFVAGLVSVFLAPLIYYAWEVTDPTHREMFTWLMSFGGSLATFPLGLAVWFSVLETKPEDERGRLAHTALVASLLLFAIGGVIGFLIDGSDVTIPAHYHGCIVGVTLALMGVTYDLLPRLGFVLTHFRLARYQIIVYGSGQLLHIIGLVWSGGYGVQRKVAGAEQGLDTLERVAGMGLMGLGGLLSAVGGFMFVVIVLRALMSHRYHQAPQLSRSGA